MTLSAAIQTSAEHSYTPVARIAAGGQAEILLAVQRGAGGFEKLVVIKRLWPHLLHDEDSRRRLQLEAQLVARIQHPNICQVLNLIDDESGPLLVLEYLDGITIAKIARALPATRGRDDVRLIAGILQQACEGLHCAHVLRDRRGDSARLVHRDVSSANLLVTRDGVVKVLDFGIAKAHGEHTDAGKIRGTLAFMSPEQVYGEELDHRSDVFALGIVAYEALTGRGLFRRATPEATFEAIAYDQPPPMRPFQPAVPPRLERAVTRALSKHPDERHGSARALGQEISDAVAELGGGLSLAEIAEFMGERFREELADRSRQLGAIRRGRGRGTNTISIDLDACTGDTLLSLPTFLGHEAPMPPEPVLDGRPMALPPAPSQPIATATPTRRAHTAVGIVCGLSLLVLILVVSRAQGGEGERVAAPDPTERAAPAAARAEPMDISTPEPVMHFDPEAPQPAIEEVAPEREAKRERARKRPERPDPEAEPAEPGFLTLDSRPFADIEIDGEDAGRVPLYRIPLSPGRHRVVATLDSGESRTFSVVIESGGDLRKRVRW